MAVKIQVKDGFDNNTNCCGLGVAPLTNAFQGVSTFNNSFGTFGNSNMQRWPVSNHNHNVYGAYNSWMAPMMTTGYETQGSHLLAHAALGETQLNEVVASLNLIDPILASRIAGIASRCQVTALRIARIATFDLELARQIIRIAEYDFVAVTSISELALVNPVAARMQLQQVDAGAFGMIRNRVAGSGFATVNDEGDVYRIVARIPGATAETIDVTVRNGKLVIKAKVDTIGMSGLQSAWRQEFAIGQDVSIEAIDATIINGTLNVLLPKSAVVRNMVGQRMQDVAVC